jgi:hypothetical protein
MNQTWLSSDIIEGLMLKMKSEFPHIHGLQNPLHFGRYVSDGGFNTCIPSYVPLPKTGFFVQILSIMSRNHWICVSGNCEENEIIDINIYDSLNTNTLNNETNSHLSNLFKTHTFKQFNYIIHNVTQQNDGSNCGLHAIANAIILCKGENSEQHLFIRSLMRQHLIDLIDKYDILQPFPSNSLTINFEHLRVKMTPVFCYCRQGLNNDLMT